MEKYSMQNRYAIRISSVSLALIIALSFLCQFAEAMFSYTAIIVVVFILIFIGIVSKHILIGKTDKYLLWWFLGLIAILFSYFSSMHNRQGTMDMAFVLAGVLMLATYSKDIEPYKICLNVICFMGIVHSVGVIIGVFLPSLYSIIMRVLPLDSTGLTENEVGWISRGFATNSGISAGFIVVGLFALISKTGIEKKRKVWVVISIMALLFTGKRAHSIFGGFAVLGSYLSNSPKDNSTKRIRNVFLVALIITVVYMFAKDFLVRIPVIGEIANTINSVVLGEDASTGRFSLWTWALQLFKQNPWLGIGWGAFRRTTVGNATLVRSLDAHNIYLQLLCEMGIIGSLCVFIAFGVFFYLSYRAYSTCIKSNLEWSDSWLALTRFAYLYQIFFFLYGLTGNPFYDMHYQIIYFFSCCITMGYLYTDGKLKYLV